MNYDHNREDTRGHCFVLNFFSFKNHCFSATESGEIYLHKSPGLKPCGIFAYLDSIAITDATYWMDVKPSLLR